MPGVNYAQRFFALLLVLREETDTEHRMDALAICARLRERNGLEVDPRSVRKTLTEMIEAGLPIPGIKPYISGQRGKRYEKHNSKNLPPGRYSGHTDHTEFIPS